MTGSSDSPYPQRAEVGKRDKIRDGRTLQLSVCFDRGSDKC